MLTINQQDKDVAEYLKNCSVKYTVIPTQQGAKSDGWNHDKWLIIFKDQSFEYSTGTGHRIAFFVQSNKLRAQVKQLRELTGYTDKFPVTTELRRNPNKHSIRYEDYAVAIPPTQASVLYSLLMDASCGDETFHNFCDNYGYDKDSIKAQKIYFACQENSEKLNKVLSYKQREHLNELLQDY